jgi:hypothetical protein
LVDAVELQQLSSAAAPLEYAVTIAAPPGFSTLRVIREAIPLPDFDDLEVRLECANGEGNILLSASSPSAGPCARDLLVCRARTDRVLLLPRVVPDVLRCGTESIFSTGILPDAAPPRRGFTVVQLQRAAAASSSSAASASHLGRALGALLLLHQGRTQY